MRVFNTNLDEAGRILKDVANTVHQNTQPLFKHLSSELGCVEIGLVDHGANGTKELQESKMKSPRMMRSFCKQMVDQYKIKANKIKIVSFIINGSFITAQVMTFTKGSVGILFSSPRLKMPENISQIPALLPPILALVYNCTLIVKETAQLLKDESTQINLDPFESSDYFFPNSFVQWYPDIRDWWVGPKVSLILKVSYIGVS
ncbi:unnamed protein product [Mucor circinelloides]